MKLEFESNAVSSPLVNNFVPGDAEAPEGNSESMQMLRDGIAAAQEGDRSAARNLLLRATESDARNENAWLWLASISEYPEELLVFLNNVLEINPENERALEWAKATKALIAKTFVQRGIEAAKDDQKKFAKQCFLQAIVHDSSSELAYLWLASVSESPEEKVSHLQRVLSINPENENALTSLRNARESEAKAKLPEANSCAINGERERALDLLEEIIADAPNLEDAWMLKGHISESFSARIAAFERVLEINPENPVAKVNVDSLSMFAEISKAEKDIEQSAQEVQEIEIEDESPIEMPESSFEQELAAESVESFSDEEPIHFDSEAEPDAEDSEVAYNEPEAVSFEEVSESFDAQDAHIETDDDFQTTADLSDSLDDDDEVLSLDVEESDPVELSAPQSDQSADSPEDSEVGQFEFSEDIDSVDHDYVSESVDFSDESEDAEAAFESGAEEVAEEEEMEAVSDTHADQNAEAEQGSFEDSDNGYEADMSFGPESAEEAEDDESAGPDLSFEADQQPEITDAPEQQPENAQFEQIEEEGIHQTHPPEMPNFETADSLSPEFPSEELVGSSCAYCEVANEPNAFACHNCKAIFTISDIEMILNHDKVNKDIVAAAVKRMETDKTLRGVDATELKHLGIGYINLKDYHKGYEALEEATQKDPDDVQLVEQLDALAERIGQIEEANDRHQEEEVAGKRILVVDDSPTVRKLISGKLEKCGHEAICAVDGLDALAKINEVIPDLILLDITMPRMDGYQVCKLIRSNDATKDVPVVMISGKDGFFDKVRGRMAGTSNYITKPFGPETLMKAVKEYIQ